MRIRHLAALAAIALLPSTLQAQRSSSTLRAQCVSWDASGELHVNQSNDTQVVFRLAQDGELLKGTASNGFLAIGKPLTAQVDGIIKGNSIQLTAYWTDSASHDPVGVYTGTVNQSGRAEGETFDRRNPSTRATWYSSRMTCLAQAAPVTRPPGPPVPASALVVPAGDFREKAKSSIESTPRMATEVGPGLFQLHPVAFGGGPDPSASAWAQAGRYAADQCSKLGFVGGHFSGHHKDGDFGLICAREGAVWRDAQSSEIGATEWSFQDVNQVSWARANRAAERLCAQANQGYAGGHFNGHTLGGKYGLYCYAGPAQWFDASDAELAATGFGFATPKLDDVPWQQAMRAATGFCIGKGFSGGFMNGHQAPNRYGVVCQK